MMQYKLLDISLLKPHERFVPKNVGTLISKFKKDSSIVTPLLIEKETYVILDGHHRYFALKQLGCTKVPVFLVKYRNNDKIIVTSNTEGEPITKDDVIQAGLSGNMMASKTSRHFIAPGLIVFPVALSNCK